MGAQCGRGRIRTDDTASARQRHRHHCWQLRLRPKRVDDRQCGVIKRPVWLKRNRRQCRQCGRGRHIRFDIWHRRFQLSQLRPQKVLNLSMRSEILSRPVERDNIFVDISARNG